MEQYRTMYLELFNKISEVIEELQAIQQRTEDLYVEAEDKGVHQEEHLFLAPGDIP